MQALRQAKRLEHTHCVGAYVDARSEFAEFVRLLEHIDLEALAAKRQSHAQPAETGTDHCNAADSAHGQGSYLGGRRSRS